MGVFRRVIHDFKMFYVFLWKHHWLHRHKCVKLHLDMPYLIFNWTFKRWKKRLSKRTKEGIWCQARPGIRHQPHARRHEYTSRIFVSKIFWCSFFHSMPTSDWQQPIAQAANHWLKTAIFHHGVSFLQGLRHDRNSTTRTISSTGVCAFQLSNSVTRSPRYYAQNDGHLLTFVNI